MSEQSPERNHMLVIQDHNIWDDNNRRGATIFTNSMAKGLSELGYNVTVLSQTSSGGRNQKAVDNVLYLETDGEVGFYEQVQAFLAGSGSIEGFSLNRLEHSRGTVLRGLAEANWKVPPTLDWSAALGRPVDQVLYHVQPQWRSENSLVPFKGTDQRFVVISDFTGTELVKLGMDSSKLNKVRIGPSAKPLERPVAKAVGDALVWVGANSPEKRPKLAIDVLHELRKSGRNASLAMVGRGVREYADVEGVTTFESASEEVKNEQMAQAKVLLNTSLPDCEGFGLVITEAAALGTPAVVVPNGGAEEAARLTGGLIARSDRSVDLAASVVLGIEGPTRLRSGTVPWQNVAADWTIQIERSVGIRNGPAQRLSAIEPRGLTG